MSSAHSLRDDAPGALWLRLLATARTQGGVLTRKHLLESLSVATIKRLVRQGHLTVELPGIYRPAQISGGLGPSIAAVSHFRGGRIAARSHESAATAWGFGISPPLRIHITVSSPLAAPSRPDLAIHEGPLTAPDIVIVSGIPTTRPARTAFDLLVTLNDLDAIAVVDRILRQHHLSQGTRGVDPALLLQELDSRRGAPGTARIRRLLNLGDPLAESPMESRTRLRCIASGLPTPVAQHMVNTAEGRRFLDLAWPEFRVALEYDSRKYHSGDGAVSKDNTRHNALIAADGDWLIFYATPEMILGGPDALMGQLRAALRSRGWKG